MTPYVDFLHCTHSTLTAHRSQSAMTQTHLELSEGSVAPGGLCSVLFPWIMSESPAARHSSASFWRESCWGAYVGCDAWLHWQTCPRPCIYANTDPPTPNHSPPCPSTYVQLHAGSQKHPKEMKQTDLCMHTAVKHSVINPTCRDQTLSSSSSSALEHISVSPAAHFYPPHPHPFPAVEATLP